MTGFDAALLAGGRSTRMGRDKALLECGGRPLWIVQAAKLAALGPRRLLIASRTEQRLDLESVREVSPGETVFVADPPGDEDGPLGAITRCLRLVSGPLLVLAVDMPAMTAGFMRERLLSRVSEGRSRVFRGPHGFEALAAVYGRSALPFFEAALAGRHLALQPVLGQITDAGLCEVEPFHDADEALFANVNTPEEAVRLARGPLLP
ncbi:MAG: molybdenum cofactor guanylyltransferase [Verrucomicrobiaceae bacterium]|nr:molybdenum cofactor guanylyltransferase [Verrucomicrobiaceae bacterium]